MVTSAKQTPPAKPELLVVTGMSGAGRSTAANALEDQGWYVIDNLPPQMLGPINDLFSLSKMPLPRVAVVIDVRGGEFFAELQVQLNQLRSRDLKVQMLFLEASDQALVKRFESVRRPHPLQAEGTVVDGIAVERSLMLPLRESADLIVDTSDLNVHQLTSQIAETFGSESSRLRLNIVSFGFKYGTPADADMVIDSRFIANPHWREELRAQTGNDEAVRDYVFDQEGVEEFLEHYLLALKPVLAGYQRENKRFVTIAIGCTGGKHRSVAIANRVAAELQEQGRVVVRHRDLGRE
jgi:RNase adapter protein RapZ